MTIRTARSRSSAGYLFEEPGMTPTFPTDGVSGHAGAVQFAGIYLFVGQFIVTQIFNGSSETLQTWIDRLEPLDCCATPVLTPGEAARHPLFNPEVLQQMLEASNAEQSDAQLHSQPAQGAATPATTGQTFVPGGGNKPFTYGPWG